ncbi:MAG TPA: pyridoxal phosphate-dependent aminotransferase [Nitrospiria bacterium]|nr:pyridoxal phosphate-dependent aminotransferase [Nitrospiria bacterium]
MTADRPVIGLARRVAQLQPSATHAITAKAKALEAKGVRVIDFGVGEPDFDTPLSVKEAGIAAIREGWTKYTPPAGLDELKQAVIEKFKRDQGLAYQPNQILISCGAKHSLYNIAQALFDDGDEVLIPAPYWVSYPEQVRLQGAVPVILPTEESDGFCPSPDALARALTPRTKAIILNSPGNPTGAVYPKPLLEALGRVLRDHHCVIVSDEIYEYFVYDGAAHWSLAGLLPELGHRIIVVNGVSKSYAMTGWRIGYAAGPAPFIQAMSAIQSQSTSNPTSISQKAAIAALRSGGTFVTEMVAAFDQRRRVMADGLRQIEGVSCLMPSGGFYLFPRVTALFGRITPAGQPVRTSADLAAYLLESAHVAVVPGGAFGAEGFLRFSYALPIEQIRSGLDQLRTAIHALR